ncbi:hypothetical protein [Campylobacter phage CP21]|uniref:Uncharacterized protein n=1 Tax=Campylobacter phage CP21 TaxID=2881391 RepID=I7KLJ8_9CAUD|nr:hypothetical protein F421_gp011 [Campylobacter phage CP21]CCH63473.1 hypothetical protein [Campylobacter phage CP21]
MLELSNFLRSPFLDMPSISFNNKNTSRFIKKCFRNNGNISIISYFVFNN